MTSPTAILFPGQGSQTPEMRDLVARVRPDLLELAARVVGEDPFPRADDGTNFAQPAIFCASLAGWEALGRPVSELMAGHSMGELGALVAAGALDEREGLELVTLRGRLMHESGLAAGDGSMLALMGAGASEQAGEIAAAHDLTVANDNSPMQVVLSGAAAALPGGRRACPRARPASDRARRHRGVSLADDGRRRARVPSGAGRHEASPSPPARSSRRSPHSRSPIRAPSSPTP